MKLSFLRRACVVGGVCFTLYLNNNFQTVFASDVGRELCKLSKEGLKAVQKYQEKNPKFDPNSKHPGGWSPLMIACLRGDLELVKFLVEHGANLDEEDNYTTENVELIRARQKDFPSELDPLSQTTGFTSLFYAVISGNGDIVRLLLEKGANPDKMDARGRKAKDLLKYLEPSKSKELLNIFEVELEKIKEKRKELEKELRRKFPLEKRLMEKIVGQLGPINSVSSAIRRKENGWHDSDHPLVFLFLGSSGIGKTELAKQVAEYLHGKNKDAFIRIDMSEYSSQHEVAKFIGSPPGYVGHDEGGQLTKKLSKHPDAVVLLDEVEKAHPDVLTIMLQVFDEGRLTDGKGTTVECKNAIFVMTSNLGQTEIADEALSLRKAGKADDSFPEEFRTKTIQPILKRAFKRDEFLGRINEILYFTPFTEDQLKELANRELKKWAKRAEERHNMKLTWTPKVEDIVTQGYNVRYGARSIQHEVDRRIISKLAAANEMDQIKKGSKILIEVDQKGDVQLKIDNSQVGSNFIKSILKLS